MDEPSDRSLKQIDDRVTVFNLLSGSLLGATALVYQPFQFYLKSGLHMAASEVAMYSAFMMFPWLCKPIFGLVCDNIPLFGYRRRSYLIFVNIIAAICCCFVFLGTPIGFVIAYAALQMAMAASTVIALGSGVEYGRQTGRTRKYLLLQAACYHAGIMTTSITGGWICQVFAPVQALQVALPIACAFLLLLALATFKLMVEKKTVMDFEQTKTMLKLTLQYAKNSKTLLTAIMIFCWSVSLALGVPLYFFETNSLHFTQEIVGILAGINSAGMLLGTLIYACSIKNRTLRTHLALLVVLGLLNIFSYVFLSTPLTAYIIEALRGMANMICLLIIYGLVAEICPAGAEVFVMGYLVAIRTLGMESWTAINGYLFTHCLHEQFTLLTVIAGAICLCAGVPSFFLWRQSREQKAMAPAFDNV